MGDDFLPYIAIGVTLVLCGGLAGAILVLNSLIGPRSSSRVKDAPFECGSVPLDQPRKTISVKFYVVAILFVVFDIEAVFLFPWAILYRDLLKSPIFGAIALAEVLLFLGILAVGLWYVWGKGALDWAFDRPARRTLAEDSTHGGH
jgi:NADH-quinone oxidoreductase subunit A